jgi:V8-like Glu-specific endopeptidase
MFATNLLKNVFKALTAAAPPGPRARTRLAVEPLEAREVLSLSPVSAYAGFPFTAIVQLQATFPDRTGSTGTGVMVDRFHVLTAGHMVYSYAHGGWASQIEAIPELYGNYEPFGHAYSSYERTYNAFINYNRSHPDSTQSGDYDIALVTLRSTIGDRTSWMSYGYDNNNADFGAGAILNTAGYPGTGGYDGRHMEFSAGPIAGLSSDRLAIDYWQSSITTFRGQSGSPIWRYTRSNNSNVVYGVVDGGGGAPNTQGFGCRITQSIFNDLQSWRNADRAPATSFGSALVAATANGSGVSPPKPPSPAGDAQAARAQTTPAGPDRDGPLWGGGTAAVVPSRDATATADVLTDAPSERPG